MTTLGRRVWAVGQAIALVVTAVVLVGLFMKPDTTLRVAWYGIVPILPASFLINAALWRNVCPIATANTVLAPRKGRVINGGWSTWAATTGILLLLILVPARRLLLNENGPILAVTLVAIVLAAFVLGRVFRTKAGFCNSVCPILPVEKLYGQSPLIWIRNARCVPCSHCTVKGCMDLDQASAVFRRNGGGFGRAWLKTPMGLFAVAFPGMVYGYFQTQDSGLVEWATVYGSVLLPTAVSFFGAGLVVYVSNVHARIAAPVLAAAAIGIYYWFAAPATAQAFSLQAGVGVGLRWALLALVALWLVRSLRIQGRLGQQ